MNSIRNVQRAIDHEAERQIELLEQGIPIASETRTFDANDGRSYGMRTKEELNDYRYFPDPDLSPMIVSEEWLERIRKSMPSLPNELFAKFVSEYKLPEYDAQVLTDTKDVASYFEAVCALTSNFKAASNWTMGPVKSYLNELGLTADEFPLRPVIIAEIIALIDSGKINFAIASNKIFPELLKNPTKSALEVAQQLNVLQDSSQDSILPIVEQVIKEFPLKVEEYKNGKKAIITMFMGEIMKRSKGKADPKLASELLTKKLAEVKI
jgi:aspartyl-tRNA(Asn)/glutamyl-tRNA(Gln) amidotransferase subunit B